jgi:osmoprotectant transport system ATP-binding protein
MLKLIGVSKKFETGPAVLHTDLTIPDRKTIVLIGPSGCGKSTLLRLMIGLLPPDTGKVFLGDREVTADNSLKLRQRMGYVIQDGGLFPHLTARENVTLMARYLGWNGEKLERRLQELTVLTQFPPAGLDLYPVQLSGGQRQRVSLMRALMLDPDVLLMDEPLGALDPMIRANLQADLRRIFRGLGKTVVLVTHDLREAAFFADQIVLMDHGAIIQEGRIEELTRSPATPFVTQFIRAQKNEEV